MPLHDDKTFLETRPLITDDKNEYYSDMWLVDAAAKQYLVAGTNNAMSWMFRW